MSAVENSDIVRFLPREGQEPPLLNRLPNEILTYILTLTISQTSWKHGVKYAGVCKQFHAIIKGIDGYQVWYALVRSTIPSKMPTELKTEIKEIQHLGSNCRLQYITLSYARVGKTEIQYMRSEWGPNRYILYILNSSAGGFKYKSIDVMENLQSTCKAALLRHNLTFNEENFFTVVNCHPTKDGFIVVQRGGISLWQYDESNEPKCLSFYSPFTYDDPHLLGYPYLQDSTYKDGILCLMTGHVKTRIKKSYQIDLNQKEPQFVEFNIGQAPDSNYKFLYTSNTLLQISHYEDRTYAERHKIAVVPRTLQAGYPIVTKKILQLPTRLDDLNDSVKVVGKWIFVKQDLRGPLSANTEWLTIYESESLAEWLDLDLKIIAPNSNREERFFLMGDFLCLAYFPNFVRIIHLPTKKDYTEKLNPILRLIGQKAILCGLYLDTNESGDFLHVLWQFNKAKTYNDVSDFVLKSVKIPLSVAAESRQIVPVPLRNLASSCKKCDAQIVLIAGVVLALISLIATLVLTFTHPGAILVEANGFTLTVPTVVTFIVGEAIAFTVVCVGVYLHKRKRRL